MWGILRVNQNLVSVKPEFDARTFQLARTPFRANVTGYVTAWPDIDVYFADRQRLVCGRRRRPELRSPDEKLMAGVQLDTDELIRHVHFEPRFNSLDFHCPREHTFASS